MQMPARGPERKLGTGANFRTVRSQFYIFGFLGNLTQILG